MTQFVFSDNCATTLAAPINSTQTNLAVVSGTGSLFPSLNTGQGFVATIVKNGNASIFEVILTTQITGDDFNVIQRNYTDGSIGGGAQNWNAGDTVAVFPTAVPFNNLLQIATAQPEVYTYALDTGTANTYVVNLTPAATNAASGQKYRFIAGHTNTGTSTFNGLQLLLPNGNQLPAGAIVAGGYYEAVFFLSNTYQLFGTSILSFLNAALTGTPTTPTAAVNTSTTQVSSTQFVQNQLANNFKAGNFNCINGTVSVNFGSAFPNTCLGVFVQWAFSAPDVGDVASKSTTGFTYTNGNAGLCYYFAIGN